MSTRYVYVLALLALAHPALAAEPDDAVQLWNGRALDTVRQKRASDSDTARLVAMLNVAMFDAMNGIVSRGPFGREQALVPNDGAPLFADFSAAAASAAHAVLVGVFPDQAPLYDGLLAGDLAALAGRPGVHAGQVWGDRVGAAVVAARANDGSSPVETQPAGSGPGVFRAAWSGVQYRNLAPFAVADPSVFVTAGPPPLGSLEYAGGLAEVRVLGNAALPDAAALATFQYWSLAAGTDQPPGDWIRIALEVAAARGLGIYERARLAALVSMALADVVAPLNATKFLYRHWRPATAIREDATAPDPTWSPRGGGIGGTPEHTSGHSAFGGAAARALAGFFCDDDIAFTHVSDSAPNGEARTYPSFSAAAIESSRSRILGGVHFEFSGAAGLEQGRGVGAEVLARKLLRKIGPRHFGSCPL